MDIKSALSRIVGQLDLSTEEMRDVMRQIMTGQCSEAQIGAFLMGMRMKSESIDEIVGAVSVMRELADKVELKSLDASLISSAPAVMGPIFSTCPPRLRSSWRPRAAPWPSTATAQCRARAAVPTCWKLPASI